jgi:hypothetical protein
VVAGDWIKLEHATPDKPEILAMADSLGIEPEHVLGAAIRVWIWADQQSRDGNALSVTQSSLDRIARVTGFGAAMVETGWLVVGDRQIEIPNFIRHNGQSAKQRALTARRAAACRSRKRNGVSVTNRAPREEKRRGIQEPPSSPNTTSNGRKQDGGGGFFGQWGSILTDLAAVGMVDATGCLRNARDNGADSEDVQRALDHFRGNPGRYSAAQLHWRISRCVAGQDGAEGWPGEPERMVADEVASRERIESKRRADIAASRAMLIVQKGRRAGRSDDEIREALESEGLEWP